MARVASKVIKIALAEEGYLEKKSNNQLDDKTNNAGYNNYTKYGRDMHRIYPEVMDFPAAWCDAFVDWCFFTAYGIATAKSLLAGNFDDYTVASASMYNKKNGWFYRDEKKPKKGDQIFFISNGKKREIQNICHTGLVYDVDDIYVYTIEGNTSSAEGVIPNGGGVFKKRYPLNSPNICGYGRPKYDKEEKKAYTEALPTLPKKGYFVEGDKSEEVKKLKKFLNWYGEYGLDAASTSIGPKTTAAINDFKKREKLNNINGQWGSGCNNKAKTIKK